MTFFVHSYSVNVSLFIDQCPILIEIFILSNIYVISYRLNVIILYLSLSFHVYLLMHPFNLLLLLILKYPFPVFLPIIFNNSVHLYYLFLFISLSISLFLLFPKSFSSVILFLPISLFACLNLSNLIY
jgi:hypothetical protein